MTRIPYATMIATVMCLIGVGIFCFTMYRGASLTIIMFDQVFHFRLLWIEAVQMIFVAIGASMAALGFMILFVGCLATGSTRYKVYRAWRSRVGGRISCAVVSKTHSHKRIKPFLLPDAPIHFTLFDLFSVYGHYVCLEYNMDAHILLPVHRHIRVHRLLENVFARR